MNLGFRRGVNELLALLGCYASYIGSSRRFRTTFGPIFKGHTVQEVCLTLEDGTDRLSRNVGKLTTSLRCIASQKRGYLISYYADPQHRLVVVEFSFSNRVHNETIMRLHCDSTVYTPVVYLLTDIELEFFFGW